MDHEELRAACARICAYAWRYCRGVEQEAAAGARALIDPLQADAKAAMALAESAADGPAAPGFDADRVAGELEKIVELAELAAAALASPRPISEGAWARLGGMTHEAAKRALDASTRPRRRRAA